MTTRTSQSIVRFKAPFALPGLDGMQLAGAYTLDVDEEEIQGLSWLAYRRVATFLHLPAIGSAGGKSQLVLVDPAELQAAMRRDDDIASAEKQEDLS